jgi:hypothetical protein
MKCPFITSYTTDDINVCQMRSHTLPKVEHTDCFGSQCEHYVLRKVHYDYYTDKCYETCPSYCKLLGYDPCKTGDVNEQS